MRYDDFPEVDPALLSPPDPFGYEHTPPGTFNDPTRPVVLSPAERDFVDLHTARRRRGEYARWVRECRARYVACHPPKPKPPPRPPKPKPTSAPKYTKRWPGIVDEPG